MDFQDIIIRYFGTADLDKVSSAALRDGMDRLRVDFGLEQDNGHRFALWTVLYMLGDAPDVDEAFDDAEDREAAREFMDMVDEMDGEDGD